MPKHAGEIWDQYQVIGSSGQKKHVVCIHCSTEYRNSHATRMVLHITKCKKCPSDIKKRFMKKSSIKVLPKEKSLQSSSELLCPSPRPSTSFGSESESSNLVSCEDNTRLSLDHTESSSNLINKLPDEDNSTLNKKDEIDADIARALYASGAPLHLLESKYWKKALKSLNSDYEPPSRYCFSNRLLDAEYSRLKYQIDEEIRLSAAVSIITDGWTNINGKGVINFIISTPKPIFYKAVYPECERETAEYLSCEISKVIEEVGPAKIVALITDNAKNMKAAWRLIQNKYPNIACIGCVAHALNLIYKDIDKLPPIKQTVEKVTKIIKYVKNKHRALAYFEKIQATLYGNLKQSLKLQCKTRWNSVVLSLESIDCNKEALKALVVADEINIENDIMIALLDDAIWVSVKNIIKVLKPISDAITKSESDNARVSEVPVTFMKLEASVEDELHSSTIFEDHEKDVIRQAITKRRDFCLRPFHLAANILDPKFMGSGLNDDQEAEANNFIYEQARLLGKDPVAIMTNAAEFRTKTGYFGKCHSAWVTTETVAPHLWWQSFASKQKLFPLAYRLLSVPPSSAAAERNWSLFANTHSKSRNRLQQDRVQKLITVRQNLKYLDDAAENLEDDSDSELDFEFIGIGREGEVDEEDEKEVESQIEGSDKDDD